MIRYTYVITYRGSQAPQPSALATAETLINLWTQSGADPDIRVDRLTLNGEVQPIDMMDKFAIETHVRTLAALL